MGQEKKQSLVFGPRELSDILPHRYPFLLVDKIIHLDLEKERIIGQKNVTMNEAFFQGHFPGAPIMPGVLIIEALAQTGGVLVHQKGYKTKIAVLLNIARAKFRRPVHPGDTLHLHAEALHVSKMGGKMKASALVEERLVVEAEMSFALVEKSQL